MCQGRPHAGHATLIPRHAPCMELCGFSSLVGVSGRVWKGGRASSLAWRLVLNTWPRWVLLLLGAASRAHDC
jgi:hypothetical protein